MGTTRPVCKRDTRSLDYSSSGDHFLPYQPLQPSVSNREAHVLPVMCIEAAVAVSQTQANEILLLGTPIIRFSPLYIPGVIEDYGGPQATLFEEPRCFSK